MLPDTCFSYLFNIMYWYSYWTKILNEKYFVYFFLFIYFFFLQLEMKDNPQLTEQTIGK